MTKKIDVSLGDYVLEGVEAPDSWSDRAISIAARTYFTAGEKTIYELVERVAKTIASPEDYKSLYDILLNQRAAFNTPVWMNVGVPNRDPQAWACLIIGVEDDMDSIQDGWRIESETFRGGSGSGVNVSKIRAAGEPLSDGNGVGSGPISLWMRPTDSIAGVVRSGGRTRRAAKMVVMDIDHPEIEEFIDTKVRAEGISRLLQQNGYDISMQGSDSANIPFQNANNSVRVDDDFMAMVDAPYKTEYVLKGRVTREVDRVVDAQKLWRKISHAAWDCGDPGIQFADTINAMNPVKNDGEIRASNPCSEYLFLDDTVCNLASLNLRKYQMTDIGELDWPTFEKDIRVLIRSMDRLVDITSYPTEKIRKTTLQYRNLGLGFANLGALLMSWGVAYDSGLGRSIAASIMAFIQMTSLSESQDLAAKYGAYPAWERNKKPQSDVINKHIAATYPLAGSQTWAFALESVIQQINPTGPLRNAQQTVLAPTGTISLLMDCETTGIEPVLAINATKTLSGSGSLDVGVDQCVKDGINYLQKDYGDHTPEEILRNFARVFQTALGDNVVHPTGHVDMMAAVQPFISGGISKTVNMPSDSTPKNIGDIYKRAWEKGVKCIAVFRDGSKAFQPVTVNKKEELDMGYVPTEEEVDYALGFVLGEELPKYLKPARRRPPGTRMGITHKFEIAGEEYYVTLNFYEDDTPCEIFIRNNKYGSETAGWVDVASIAISVGLQHGVPPSTFIEHFARKNFLPQGPVVADSSIRFADSPADYIFRWLERYLEEDADLEFVQVGNPSNPPTVTTSSTLMGEPIVWASSSPSEIQFGPCGRASGCPMRRAGSCMVCEECGETTGCS